MDIIIAKINAYIKRYYLFQSLKGLMYLAIYFSISVVLFSLLEHLYQFDTLGRGILFFSFITSFIAIAYYFLIRNALKVFAWGKLMSQEEASKHIGAFFTEIDDQLINTLQLQAIAKHENNELALASIEQKVDRLRAFSFQKAVDFSELKTYLKYLSLPVVTLLLVLVFSPRIITESSNRIIKFNQEFEPEAPFEFNILNEELKALQYESFELKLALKGNTIPKDVNIIIGQQKFPLKRTGKYHFKYPFSKLTKSVSFKFEALEFESKTYTLKVVPKPIINSFNVNIEYPMYLRMQDDVLNNLGNFKVPAGAKVTWSLKTKNVSKLAFKMKDTILPALPKGDNEFGMEMEMDQSFTYSIVESNRDYTNLNPAMYLLKVVPDDYPKINISSFEDSLNVGLIYFTGEVYDDYGFRDLAFFYKSKAVNNYTRTNISVNKQLTQDQFHHRLDLKQLGFNLGAEIDYFFEVRDNDALNGYKSAKSAIYTYKLKTKEEIEEKYKDVSASLKTGMDRTMEQALKLQSKIKDLKERLIAKKELDWADKKELEKIKNDQAVLKDQLEQLLKEKESISRQQQSIGEKNEAIKEKEALLEEMLKDLVNDEVDEMMEKIEDLMEKLNKEDLLKEMDKMSQQNENTSEELDRLKELYKQLEFEYQYDEAINDLEELANEQKALAKQKESEMNNEALAKKQEEINKDLDQFSKKMDELEKLNKEMEKPSESFQKNEKEQESIKSEQQQAQESLSKGKRKNAQESQQKAGEQMEDLAQQMKQQQEQMQQEQIAVDYETLRQILDNVLTLSFDQEDLLTIAENMNRNSPNYRKVVLEQYKIKDNLQIIADSLKSISKRVIQIKSFVNEELGKLNTSLDYALNGFEQLKFNRALTNQQYAITSLNNIALMLNESLNNMQKQMNAQKSGSKSCDKPGKSGKGKGNKSKRQIEKLRQMNDALSKKMQGMKNSEGKGKLKSKGLAQMAKEQAQIRQLLQEINEAHNKDGSKKLGDLEDILKKMEQNEKDIVNKKLSEELYQRQRNIETRLIKATDALKEQDKNDEREAESVSEYETSEPPTYLEYIKKKEKQVELLRSIPPKFSPFYKKLVNDYFKAISN